MRNRVLISGLCLSLLALLIACGPQAADESPKTSPKDRTPPALTIMQPVDNSSTDKADVAVSGKTEADAKVTVNGKAIRVNADGTFSATVTLTSGKNVLEFVASDDAGNAVREPITVTYNRPPAVQQPAPQAGTTEETVHITRTGSKYHRAGCRYLSQSDIPIALSQAKAQGYTPCSVCNPPQ